jgi:cell division protease FtsH
VRERHPATAAHILQGSQVLRAGQADVRRARERTRRKRVAKLVAAFLLVDGYLWYRYLDGNPIAPPSLPDDWVLWAPMLLLVLLFGAVMLFPLASGRSPAVVIRPEHIETGLTEVRGLDGQVEEVLRTLDVFLGYATFREQLGGNPRRGLLFEGPPGTGKTYLAKAMAKQAGVPFLYVSAPAFQSMWFGMTSTKIRSFFRQLRKAARKQGGAIGFIEEIDAIGLTRGGLNASPPADPRRTVSHMIGGSGTAGMVNELLIQLQSFDQPPLRQRVRGRAVEWVNSFLPAGRGLRTGRPIYNNILVIAATNRADSLDPALLRPGRFDRRLYFDLPTKSGRRDLIDFFLDQKAHHPQLDEPEVRDRLAHDTLGYTPVMIEHLFDESLLVALRDGRRQMNVDDVYEAKLTEEIGLKQPVIYTDGERRSIATHEAGHATAAYFLGKGRRLEMLSIIKRRESLGLLAHGDIEERFTRSRSELEAQLAISLAGLASEEVFLGETGTGPASDLAHATEIAAAMVGAFGMAGSLVSYEAMAEGPINASNLAAKVLGDPDGKQRVEDILEQQKQRVTALLTENSDVLDALRDALMERDELVGEAIVRVVEDALTKRDRA